MRSGRLGTKATGRVMDVVAAGFARVTGTATATACRAGAAAGGGAAEGPEQDLRSVRSDRVVCTK